MLSRPSRRKKGRVTCNCSHYFFLTSPPPAASGLGKCWCLLEAAWSFSESLSKNYAGRDSNCHHLSKPCFLHKATSSSLSLSSVRVSTDQVKAQAPFEKIIKGQKRGKVPTIVTKGERHCWHSMFHQMSLGWIWIAEYCQYLCPSVFSIFEFLIPWAFVKQGALCWEQGCSQPPCHYAGMNGKMHKAQQWKGQWIQQRGGGAQPAFHSPSVFFQCMYLLNFIYSLLKNFQTLSLFLKVLNIP